MKIAQVAPLYESVPPKFYGGTERVVSYLTEELIRQGNDVTLFASGDSVTSARLISNTEKALRLNAKCSDHLSHHIVQLQEIAERANEFDIIHFHNDYIHFPISVHFNVPYVTTLHGRMDMPELQHVYNKFPQQPVISISNKQREPMPQANWVGTVYHGLPLNLLNIGTGEGNYFVFLGRISPEKRVDRAIEIAKATGIQLKIAAKIDSEDQTYFDNHIKQLLDDPLVEFIGEINEDQKEKFLGNALAMLFPIDWPEPFGIVMIESMACGTPVIAFNSGSVPEVIDDGKSGFIVNSVDEAIRAVEKLHLLPKRNARNCFEERFTVERMTRNYIEIYQKMIDMQVRSGKLNYMNQHFFAEQQMETPYTAAQK
ncbi:MAG TPA: glycosyltransferase family 4 protein [Chitinophagaceae bacterium]|nr:glycosyltransferase family 4 protein [Chitinophagaceae bacterium]